MFAYAYSSETLLASSGSGLLRCEETLMGNQNLLFNKPCFGGTLCVPKLTGRSSGAKNRL